jgi:trimethylamine--corrinoid protein Co-methyltransferase
MLVIVSAGSERSLSVLGAEKVRAIHDASLRVLSETGVTMPLAPPQRAQARELGLLVDSDSKRVRFPPTIVTQALARAPSSYRLCARNPEDDLLLDGRQSYLTLDGSAVRLIDLEKGELRPSTRADLESAVRLADALDPISILCPALSAGDCSPRMQPLVETAALLTGSSKHAQAMTVVDPASAEAAVQMAAEIAGGAEALRQRPILSGFQCSISPLSYDARSLQAAFVFAGAGVPTGFVNMAIACGTGPATLAGSVVLTNSELLAGIALLQLFHPGAPTFYGSCSTVMELRKGGVTGGGPEDALLQAACIEMARFYHLPSCIGTFATGAKEIDWQAGVENALSGVVSLLAGADIVYGAGLLQAAKVFSFEQLLLDCELFEMLRHLAAGMPVDEESLALEVIDAVGPGGHFMEQEHTRKHMREIWQPKLLDRMPFEAWREAGRPTALSRARERAREILATHEPEPLRCEQQIREILCARAGIR